MAYAETGGLQRRVDVVFRLYDDGLGFRYEFPDQPALKTVRIGSELTEFNLTENGEALWCARMGMEPRRIPLRSHPNRRRSAAPRRR